MEAFLKPFQNLKIQLKEITSATDNFNDQNNLIGVGGFGKVYKGQVSHSKGKSWAAIKRLDRKHGQGQTEFQKEIEALSRYRHANLISLLGFCYQGNEMILVYEYASRGSLDKILSSPDLTWSRRLKICLDVAKGLGYLHDPRGTHQRLIHCDIKSANILLDHQWTAKLSDFGLSIMGPANEQHSVVLTNPSGTPGYCDPQYAMTHTLTKESDIYSFGVVLFEVLCGKLCCTYSNGKVQKELLPTWIKSYEQKKLNDNIFKYPTTDQTMSQRTLATFSDIAYQCLKTHREGRPKMAEVLTKLETALRHQEAYDSEMSIRSLQEFRDLNIQLEEITSATDNFNDQNNCIGVGGFGKVYKGKVSHSEGRSLVAIKRQNPKHGQGTHEFLKEITTLSRYRHENLISLLGFCCKGSEMILLYEFATRGSLDRHLNSPHLTWAQRLKICLDAAKGLSYLHDPRETHQRLIHRDIKSANILLDDQWNGKVSDFGLSKMGPADELQSVIFTSASGTPGYYDPQYMMTNILTQGSDVYSFGVVLFEVLCGRLCCTYSNGRLQQILVPTWIRAYKQNKLTDIIFKNPTIQPLDQIALVTLSDIAYRCLKESREDRPKMAEVVTELEIALASHVLSRWKSLFDYEEMTKTAEPPLINYRSKVELWKLLSKGVFLNGGKTWFSLNKKGEHCEMISIAECLDAVPSEFKSEYNSRFAVGTYRSENGIFKTCVKAQFLSPGITYTVNLVFKMYLKKGRKCHGLISLKYKLQGDAKTSMSYLAYEREDGWWIAELYQFTCDQRTVDLEILFDGFDQYSYAFIEVEGIEFQPLEKVEHKEEKEPIFDSDANWENKLPTDYAGIMKWSTNSVQWTTKKEAYSLIRQGFLIDDGEKWFSLDKNGKKCHMLSARAACIEGRMYTHMLSSPESRFGEAFEFSLWRLITLSTIQSHLVSARTTYASYLVYRLPKDQSGFEAPVKVKDLGSDHISYIYLVSPQTPDIKLKADQNTHNPLNSPKIKGLPQKRNDGWMEVQIWEFHTATTTEMIHMRLKLSGSGATIPDGLIIEGIEFRSI